MVILRSEITDLRDVPLSEVSELGMGAEVRRIVPASEDVRRVPVAAFNSAI